MSAEGGRAAMQKLRDTEADAESERNVPGRSGKANTQGSHGEETQRIFHSLAPAAAEAIP
jgi:hypothetical protein